MDNISSSLASDLASDLASALALSTITLLFLLYLSLFELPLPFLTRLQLSTRIPFLWARCLARIERLMAIEKH